MSTEPDINTVYDIAGYIVDMARRKDDAGNFFFGRTDVVAAGARHVTVFIESKAPAPDVLLYLDDTAARLRANGTRRDTQLAMMIEWIVKEQRRLDAGNAG